jgi:hypothetical protein
VNYGGGGGGGGFSAPAAPSEEDYLAGDATYIAQLSALKNALDSYKADQAAQSSKYDVDYDTAVKQLGFNMGVDDPSTPDVNEALTTGTWNWADPLTAAGRAKASTTNDFSSRGQLQSSGYADALQNLERSLGQQNTALADSRTSFLGDLTRQGTQYQSQNTLAQQAARADAIARRAAQYGL